MNKVCVICGKEFTPKTANGVMCSPECRRIAHNRRCIERQRKRRQEQRAKKDEPKEQRARGERKWGHPTYGPRECVRCGKMFKPTGSRDKYCSVGCRFPSKAVKNEKIEPMSKLAEINEKARKAGMNYGAYVARYGG